MLRRIVCEGAPRDLGLDQGRACRKATRARLGASPTTRWLAPLRRALAPTPGLARELARHFPHLAERTEGLASGARVAHETLVAALGRELDDPARGALDAGLVEPVPARPVLSARLQAVAADGAELLLRESRPEVGYRSLALTRPWLAPALAGVNEAGLAMVCAFSGPGGAGPRTATLLGEQCLERFDGVENALEWCERRPGSGPARLWFADAAGAVGAVELRAGVERHRLDARALGATAQGSEPGLWLQLDPADRGLRLAEKRGEAGERFALAPSDAAS